MDDSDDPDDGIYEGLDLVRGSLEHHRKRRARRR
jgi:hypothetical protein